MESTRPRHPATAFHDPAERWRKHHDEKILNMGRSKKEMRIIAPCMQMSKDVRQVNA